MPEFAGDALVLALAACVPIATFFAARWCIRQYRRSAGWPRRLAWAAGQVAITVFLLSLVFAAGEAYYRFVYDDTDLLDMSLASQRWHLRHYQMNEQGFRDDIDYSNTPARGKWRVTVLGDSFTAAAGVPNVADRFVNRLRDAHDSDWEVHALAENGADTGREWYHLQTAQIGGYRTNFVLVAYCPNDLCDLIPGWPEMGLRIKQRYDELPYLAHHSYFLNTILSRWIAATDTDGRSYFERVYAAYQGEIWPQQVDRLRNLQQYCHERGMGFAIVLFPFVQAPDDRRLVELHELMQRDLSFAPVLDLRPLYAGRPGDHWTANPHDSHPNEAAHAVAARAIDEFLSALKARTSAGL